MSWQELSLTVPFEYVEPVSYLFHRYGKGLTTEPLGDGRVLLRTWLPGEAGEHLARIEVGVRLISAVQPLEPLEIRQLADDEDWQNSWKEHFRVLPVGRRLLIKPSWLELDAAEQSSGRVVIELDPGLAFGTGYHPSTYTCLEALEALAQPGMAALDLGTGSGILTIAALRLGVARVAALDIDPQAVTAARRNFRRLRLQSQVELAQGSVPHPLAGGGRVRSGYGQHLGAGGGRPRPVHLPGPQTGGVVHRLRDAGQPAAGGGCGAAAPGLHAATKLAQGRMDHAGLPDAARRKLAPGRPAAFAVDAVSVAKSGTVANSPLRAVIRAGYEFAAAGGNPGRCEFAAAVAHSGRL